MDKVVHFEIPADNLERAQKFYQKVFGWKIEKWPMPADSEYQAEYYGIHTVAVDDKMTPKEPGAINGGMLKRHGGFNSPVITINVDSIDASAKKIEDSGGKVVNKKMSVGDMGFIAYFKDSESNLVGLWENAKKPAKPAKKK